MEMSSLLHARTMTGLYLHIRKTKEPTDICSCSSFNSCDRAPVGTDLVSYTGFMCLNNWFIFHLKTEELTSVHSTRTAPRGLHDGTVSTPAAVQKQTILTDISVGRVKVMVKGRVAPLLN